MTLVKTPKIIEVQVRYILIVNILKIKKLPKKKTYFIFHFAMNMLNFLIIYSD